MRTSRILPLFGPALALYLVADAAAEARGLDRLTWLLAGLAIAFTLTPFFVRGLVRDEIPGARSVGLLGGLAGVALASSLVPHALSGLRELTLALLLPLVAFVLVDLAWRVPDALALRRRLRPALLLATGSALVLGVLASMPALSLGSELVLVPSFFARLPLWSVLAAIVAALALRLSRRRLGSTPEALAANAWAVLGLLPALAAGTVVVLAHRGLAPTTWAPTLVATGAAAALFGHVALVDPRRRLRAGRAVRRSVVRALGVVAVGALAFVAHDALPREPIPFVTALVLGWAGVSGFLYLAERAVHRLLAPYGGRLLDAVKTAREALPRCAHLDDLTAAVLRPLREATGSPDAQPLLLGLDPGREASLDAAGNPRIRARDFPEELLFLADLGDEGAASSAALQSALESSGRLIIARSIDAQVVRRAELRPLGELLHALDALCVVPLVREGELEGALVIPRGRRGSALALEEIHALDTLAHEVTGLLSIFAARERARGRVGEIS
ncbi:MAG: hypothetical protein KF901_33730, partial [Myxococcales bacterium]|nr:hypothetical protein [Myxococcales bacterium]